LHARLPAHVALPAPLQLDLPEHDDLPEQDAFVGHGGLAGHAHESGVATQTSSPCSGGGNAAREGVPSRAVRPIDGAVVPSGVVGALTMGAGLDAQPATIPATAHPARTCATLGITCMDPRSPEHFGSAPPCATFSARLGLTAVPVAPGLPLLGNLLQFRRDPLRFLCSMRERHGDVVEVAIGPMKTTLLSHPDLVEDVLVTRSKLWQKDRFLQTTLRPVLGDGLLSSEGDFWRKQRRLAQPAFHRDRIAAYADIMVDEASRLARSWRDGEVRDVHKDMMRLTLAIVAQTLFGADVGDYAEDVGKALEAVLAVVADPVELFLPLLKRLPTPQRRRFDRAVTRLDGIIYRVIEERRRAGAAETVDLLSMLLHAQDEDGSRMSDRQLRDECLTLFLAGHETTAINLSWTWLLLSRHPEAKNRLVRELRDVLGDRAATFADVPELRYTGHVVAESLRLYPPAWSLAREAREDVDVGGYRIRRGHQVWFCPWAIQRDARWFDAPDLFRPERWEDDFAKRLPRYAYFPFGGGPRLCIGQAFAQLEAVLVLATLARAFEVDVLPTPPAVPEPSVTLRPRHGLRVRLSRPSRA
jgi:cytochrome P450